MRMAQPLAPPGLLVFNRLKNQGGEAWNIGRSAVQG
jgi:hypothetical protein